MRGELLVIGIITYQEYLTTSGSTSIADELRVVFMVLFGLGDLDLF